MLVHRDQLAKVKELQFVLVYCEYCTVHPSYYSDYFDLFRKIFELF